MDGYNVQPDDLRGAAGDIADAIAAADDTNLEKVSGEGKAYGHDKCANAAKSFGATWELAKQILQQRSASAGEALEGAAKAYESQEGDAKSTFDGQPTPSPTPGPAPTPGG